MTEALAKARNALSAGRLETVLLLAILAVATAWRLHGVAFGLPALNDPDEPLFMMTAIEMLRNHSLNPGWFGHPGTTTLYCLAAIVLAVGGAGTATGRFPDIGDFAHAVYADPGIVFLPARLFFVVCGVACVFLLWKLGRQLGGARLGLAAAALLAVNANHIELSQIIRTDMQATVFMLLATLSSLAIAREGRMRDYLLAGLFVGLACATKWPAALIALSPLCAGLDRMRRDPRERYRLAAFAAASLGALLIASPYLVLDYDTVLRNLSGEARPVHPGATGGGFFANLRWYVANPFRASFGIAGLLLVAVGIVWKGPERRTWAIAVLPGYLAFLVVVAAQALRWERWVVPLMPIACLAAARGLCGLADLLRTRSGYRGPWIEAAAVLALALPMMHTASVKAAERNNDTRQIASAWVRTHVPEGRSILVEHAAIDLLGGPWKFRFPLGSAGCVDARQMLTGEVRYADVEPLRKERPIVDLGHVDLGKLASCRADYAVFSNYARYAEGSAERVPYDRLIAGGSILRIIPPQAGISSGPAVYIVRIGRR